MSLRPPTNTAGLTTLFEHRAQARCQAHDVPVLNDYEYWFCEECRRDDFREIRELKRKQDRLDSERRINELTEALRRTLPDALKRTEGQ